MLQCPVFMEKKKKKREKTITYDNFFKKKVKKELEK
jgi:hypothetical protein